MIYIRDAPEYIYSPIHIYFPFSDGNGSADFYYKFRKRHRTSSSGSPTSTKPNGSGHTISSTSPSNTVASPSQKESTEIMDLAPSYLDRSKFATEQQRFGPTTQTSATR